jgi:hypothetical protein
MHYFQLRKKLKISSIMAVPTLSYPEEFLTGKNREHSRIKAVDMKCIRIVRYT